MEKNKSSLNTTPSEKSSSPETLIINKTTPQQTNPTEKSSPKYNISKKWIAIEAVLLVIIILLSLSYGLYKYFYKSKASSISQTKPTSTSSPTLTPDQITNWKTHSQDNFSLKLPPNTNDFLCDESA